MNIRGGSKDRIDLKKEELKLELSKPLWIRNVYKIKRLRESIERNEKIAYKYCKKRREMKDEVLKR